MSKLKEVLNYVKNSLTKTIASHFPFNAMTSIVPDALSCCFGYLWRYSISWLGVGKAEIGILYAATWPSRFVFLCRDRTFVPRVAGTPLERPWRHCPESQRSNISKYTKIDCPCIDVVGRSALVPALSPGVGTTDVLRVRTNENDDVCLRPTNSKKIRDFYYETHHVHSLSSKCYACEIWDAGQCWGSRTRYRFTW